MIPTIFTYAAQSVTVTTLLGTNPTRFWSFNQAPHAKDDAIAAAPYSVWQLVYGSPANYIGGLPDSDNTGIQVDCYATTATGARSVLIALRDAFEPHGYVTAYNGEDRDTATGLYRAGFTVEFWTDRGS
ncbi:tail completion protein gp17 [Luteimonas saliphila]|uniref:tail completion protein gp17 n=1 Tax=Luteimonas saliphila TaxID=2804919 RepID=UPI00192DCE66|nr:hypothetical protein [Luteimonas saliphila]